MHIDSERVATQDVLWACSLGGGTRARVSRRCTSAKKATSICGRYWCKERITFWDPLGKTVTCDDGGGSSRREEGKPPRNGRWWRWHGSWRYCCIGCG